MQEVMIILNGASRIAIDEKIKDGDDFVIVKALSRSKKQIGRSLPTVLAELPGTMKTSNYHYLESYCKRGLVVEAFQ